MRTILGLIVILLIGFTLLALLCVGILKGHVLLVIAGAVVGAIGFGLIFSLLGGRL